MNRSTVFIGVLGGILAAGTAHYPLYRWLPSAIVYDWPAADGHTAILGLAATAVILLLTGFLAGRFSGSQSRWGAAGAGAVAGLIAAWIMEAAWGGAAAGVYGARPMLAHGIHAAKDETEFYYLLTHSISMTIWDVYSSIVTATVGGLVLGGLGGLCAGPGKRAARFTSGLWLSVCAVMVPMASLELTISIFTFGLLGSNIQKAADQGGFTLPYPAESASVWPIAASLVWLIFWQFLAWQTVRKSPAGRRMNFLVALGAALIVNVAMAIVILPLSSLLLNLPIGYSYGGYLLLLALSGGLAWWATKARFEPRRPSSPEKRGGLWRQLGDFFQRTGEARSAAWYFLLISILVLFTLRPDYHIIWLYAGLVSGVLFALLGLYETRNSTPPMEETPPRWFDIGLLSGLLNAIFTSLMALAPLSLVMIEIVLIPPLSQTSEAEALAAATQTLPEVVRTAYLTSLGIASGLILLAFPYTLFFTAIGTLWEKRREARQPQETSLV